MLRAVWPGLSVSLQKEVHQKKTRICFVLLSAPWSVLCYYAEEISLRVPLQVTHLLTSSQEAVRYLLAGQKPSPQDPTNGSYLWYYKVSQRLFKFFSFIQSSPNVFPSCRCIKIQNKCLEKSVEPVHHLCVHLEGAGLKQEVVVLPDMGWSEVAASEFSSRSTSCFF